MESVSDPDATFAKATGNGASEPSRPVLAGLVHAAPVHLLVATLDEGCLLDVSEAFARLSGRAPHEMLGRAATDLGVLAEPEQWHALRRDVLATGSTRNAEVTLVSPTADLIRMLADAEVVEVEGVPCMVVHLIDAGALRRVEADLQESESRLRFVLAQARMGIWTLDMGEGKVRWSPDMGPLYGLPVGTEGIPSDTFFSLVHPDDRDAVRAADDEAMAGADLYQVEFRVRLPDGRLCWLEARGSVTGRDDDGAPLSIVGVTIDVTARRTAEDALRESERTARDLLAAAGRQASELALLDRVRSALARELDLPVLFRTVVQAVADTFGYALVSLYLRDEDDLVLQHQVGYEALVERLPVSAGVAGRVVRQGEPALVEDVRADPAFVGNTAGIESRVCVPLRDRGRVVGVLNVESTTGNRMAAGDLRLMVALSEHISVAIGRARLFADAKHSEERLRMALGAARMATWEWNLDTGEVAPSDGMSALVGLPPGEMPTPAYVQSITLPEDLPAVREAEERLRAGERHYTAEYRIRLPNGEARWLSDRGERADDGGPLVLGITQDITKRKEAEEALAGERDMLDALMDHLPDPVYVKDRNSRFQRLNRVTARHLGLDDPAEAVGKTDFDFFPEVLARQYFADEQRVMATGEPVLNKLEPQGLGEDAAWWLTSTVPLRDERGRVVALIGAARDVTERRRLEDELRTARDRAEAGNRAKSDFLSTMSHELRTPMNAIIGYAHLLLDGLDGPLSAAQDADVRRITEAADLLLALIEDVLDLSRIEVGDLPVRPQPVNVAEEVAAVRDDLRLEADAKGLGFEIALPADLPSLVADPVRLRQMLLNLASNAVKFTEQGRVTISARVDGAWMEIAVADTGIGIAPNVLPTVFGAFQQGESGTNRRYGGTGLGLAITQRLARLHGGEVLAASTPGIGSTFRLRLPLAGPDAGGEG